MNDDIALRAAYSRLLRNTHERSAARRLLETADRYDVRRAAEETIRWCDEQERRILATIAALREVEYERR